MNRESSSNNLRWMLYFTFTLAVLLFLSTPVYAAETSESVLVDVTVPSSLNVILHEDGTNTISEFKIQNNTILPVHLDKIQTTALDEWELVGTDAEIPTDQKQISLNMEDHVLSAGENTISDVSFEPSEYHRTIISPNYPDRYPDNMTEEENYWEETFSGASGIQITFSKDSELQEVYFDWLQIYDSSGKSVSGKLAGKSFAGETYMVHGDYVKIAMHSDEYWGYDGFSATLTPVYKNGEFNATVTPSEKLLNWDVKRGFFTTDLANHEAFKFTLDFSIGQKDFIVSFDSNGSSDTLSSITAMNGEVVELPVITRNGSVFGGWKDQNGNIYNDSLIMPAGGSVLIAQWEHHPILMTGTEFNATIPAEATAVVFTDEIAPEGVTYTDVSAEQNESVVAWLDNTVYKVSSQISGVKVIANTDSSYMFNGCTDINSIDVKMLDVSSTTNMRNMFSSAGYNAASFELDLTGWDTSSVTNMRNMFEKTGYKANSLKLDLSGWNTSAVKNMTYMFSHAGYNATEWNIVGLSGWNTESVTNIAYMFYRAGYNAASFEFDLSKWNTSAVTNIRNVFQEAGYKAPVFKVNVSSWDLPGVKDTGWMFSYSGANSNNVTIDLSGWNLSNATTLQYMFSNAGLGADMFYIDVTDWKLGSITSMNSMFYTTASSANDYKIDGLNTWDTASVTNMDNLFYKSGIKEVDFSSWNTAKVTSMKNFLVTCNYLYKMVLGEDFAFVGLGSGYAILPTPSNKYITGADGKWYNEETGIGYNKNSIPGNFAATYVAVPVSITQ